MTPKELKKLSPEKQQKFRDCFIKGEPDPEFETPLTDEDIKLKIKKKKFWEKFTPEQREELIRDTERFRN